MRYEVRCTTCGASVMVAGWLSLTIFRWLSRNDTHHGKKTVYEIAPQSTKSVGTPESLNTKGAAE